MGPTRIPARRPVHYHCPRCHHVLEVDQDPPPEQLSCGKCGSTFPSEPDATVDSAIRREWTEKTCDGNADDKHVLHCPHCQTEQRVDATPLPEVLSCDVCGSTFASEPDGTVDFDPFGTGGEFAHFELIDQVGRGTFGIVWKARDTRLDRIVALKIPRRERLTPNEVERFLAEAQTAAQLKHPGIVSIHDTGRVGYTVYIATDFVAGETLDHWLEGRTVTPAMAAEMLALVADALHHAHESGIVHRDIKPSNIIVDVDHQPFVTDFGLAKRESVDATLAVEGSLLGTPAYMSPEQARGEAHSADRRSDLYSLGTILFQMLTGERPFRGSRQMILKQVIENEAPHPRRLNSNVPEDLDTICLKCLEKIPARRYESCSELADELRRYLRGEPIKARPITSTMRAVRWCMRNPGTAGLVAALLLTLMVGFAVSTTQWLRANLHAKSAVSEAERASQAALMAEAAREKTMQYLYVAHMNLAQQAYELADPQRAIEILDRHEPRINGADRRSFEWFYWQRQASRWLKSLPHEQAVQSVAISRDGRSVATGSAAGVITIWETVSGKILHQLGESEGGHDGEIFALAFSPADPSMLVSAGGDRTIRVWDTSSGDLLAHAELQRAPFALAMADDGQTLVSAGADTAVRIWDLEFGSEQQLISERRVLNGHFDFVYSVAISSDGSRIASGGLDRTVRIWDAESGENLQTLEGHDLEVWSVAFSPDGTLLASGGADHKVGLWDVQQGRMITALSGHSDRVRSVVFSPHGSLLVSASHDRTIRLWDMTAESKPLQVNRRDINRRDDHFFERMQLPNSGFPKDEFKGHAGYVTCLAWSQNGKTLVSGSVDQTARLWNVSELQRRSSLRDHTKTVNAISISADGRTMLSGSNDRTARFWDLATMQQVGQPIEHQHMVLTVAIAPDGQTYATGSFDNTIRLGSLSGSQPIELNGHERAVSSVVFSDGSSSLASGSHDGTVVIWDVATGQQRLRYDQHGDRVQAIAFLPDGTVASAGSDKVIHIWDPSTGETLHQLKGHTGTIWALALSPDGTLLASAGFDRSVRLWDLGEHRPVRTIDAHAEPVRCLAFCPDGVTLASGGDDKTIKLWDIATGEPKTTFKGHKYRVWSLGFTPQGEHLLSASLLIKIWHGPRE